MRAVAAELAPARGFSARGALELESTVCCDRLTYDWSVQRVEVELMNVSAQGNETRTSRAFQHLFHRLSMISCHCVQDGVSITEAGRDMMAAGMDAAFAAAAEAEARGQDGNGCVIVDPGTGEIVASGGDNSAAHPLK